MILRASDGIKEREGVICKIREKFSFVGKKEGAYFPEKDYLTGFYDIFVFLKILYRF